MVPPGIRDHADEGGRRRRRTGRGRRCGHGASPALTQPGSSPARARYLALGDSYTIGERVAPSERWPAQMATALRASGVAVADPEFIAGTGWTTEDLASAIHSARPAGPFGLVSLQIGVNNQFRGRMAEEYDPQFRQVLRQAVECAGGMASRLVVLSIPDWGATPYVAGRDRYRIAVEIDAFNAVNRACALAAGARYVDVTPSSREVATNRSLLADDGLHPSATMYAAWAELALPEAARALEAHRR